MQGFYVHASNIHTDESETYGPFPGQPAFTYEFMRSESDDVPDDDHIFFYREPCVGLDLGADHWVDQEGEMRWDGWRRCYATDGQFGIERGPFWTDLNIEMVDVPTRAWESNQLRDIPAQDAQSDPVVSQATQQQE